MNSLLILRARCPSLAQDGSPFSLQFRSLISSSGWGWRQLLHLNRTPVVPSQRDYDMSRSRFLPRTRSASAPRASFKPGSEAAKRRSCDWAGGFHQADHLGWNSDPGKKKAWPVENKGGPKKAGKSAKRGANSGEAVA